MSPHTRDGAAADTPSVLRIHVPALARAAWQRRIGLFKVWGAVAVLALGVVLLLPRWYASGVTLVPAPQDGLSLDLSGLGMPLGGAALNLGSGPTPQDELKMVVQSRAVADSMVARFDLVRRYHVKQRRDAREALASHTTLTTPREGQVIVEIEAQDPVLARDEAAAYALLASSESVRMKTSLATQRRSYLETRLNELQHEFDAASQRVREFEEQHGAFALPDQAKETMDAAGQLQTQVALLETELAGARRFFTDQSAEVQGLHDRIGALNGQLDKLARRGGTLMVRGNALPEIKEQYTRLTADQMSLAAVIELLRRFYEQARVEESNPVPTFSVLDAAEIPERHARPRRGLTVIVAVALAMAGSLGWLQWQLAQGAGARVPDDTLPKLRDVTVEDESSVRAA